MKNTPLNWFSLLAVTSVCTGSPEAPGFVQCINARDFSRDAEAGTAGDLGPEGLGFVPAADSPNGKPLLILANEVSGNVSIFKIDS